MFDQLASGITISGREPRIDVHYLKTRTGLHVCSGVRRRMSRYPVPLAQRFRRYGRRFTGHNWIR